MKVNMDNKDFSVDKFKEWFDITNDEREFKLDKSLKIKELIGKTVESSVNQKKLSSKLLIESGDREEVIKEFYENGGEVVDVDGKTLLIEVKSGSFYINKNYINESSF